jgi:hypothetical protein
MASGPYVAKMLEKVCPICGKRFYPPVLDDWVYKKTKSHDGGYAYLCSWSCFNKFKGVKKSGRRKSNICR